MVAAGAGELLTAAVAEMLGIPRASADWVKRGPCVRVDGGQRFEAEDGRRGFLDVPAPASAAGMLAVEGPGGWLPFDRHHGPGEWRAIRLRLKQAVLAANFRRAVRTLGQDPAQVLVVGGPAGDEELLGVLARSLPDGVAVGRGDVGGTCPGGPLGHRYAVALGLALAPRPRRNVPGTPPTYRDTRGRERDRAPPSSCGEARNRAGGGHRHHADAGGDRGGEHDDSPAPVRRAQPRLRLPVLRPHRRDRGVAPTAPVHADRR